MIQNMYTPRSYICQVCICSRLHRFLGEKDGTILKKKKNNKYWTELLSGHIQHLCVQNIQYIHTINLFVTRSEIKKFFSAGLHEIFLHF